VVGGYGSEQGRKSLDAVFLAVAALGLKLLGGTPFGSTTGRASRYAPTSAVPADCKATVSSAGPTVPTSYEDRPIATAASSSSAD